MGGNYVTRIDSLRMELVSLQKPPFLPTWMHGEVGSLQPEESSHEPALLAPHMARIKLLLFISHPVLWCFVTATQMDEARLAHGAHKNSFF